MSNASVVRYSDAELEEFRLMILDRLHHAKEELDDLRGQILDITESLEGDFGNDYVDDSSVVTDLEMLNNMAIRKRKYIQDLENALIRIKNKTYGICTITGELIDKKRLIAVPTTTKSLQGKNMEQAAQKPESAAKSTASDDDEEDRPKRPAPTPGTGKIITRVIRKSGGTPKPAPMVDEDEDDEFGDDDVMVDLKRLSGDDMSDDVDDDSSSSDEDFDLDNFADDPGDDSDEEN